MTDPLLQLPRDEPAVPVGSYVRIAVIEAAIIAALWILGQFFS